MELQESDEQVDTKIEFDWIMRFFDAVGNISNEELQRLWGKVLAGEMKHFEQFNQYWGGCKNR